MNEMKRWMILVESVTKRAPNVSTFFASDLLQTQKRTENIWMIWKDIKKEIEWEEQNNYEYPTDILSPPDAEDTKAWNALLGR